MSKQYYLSSNGIQRGPFPHEIIIQKIQASEHQWTDYVFDEDVGDWMLLLEHPEFSANLAVKPQTPPQGHLPSEEVGESPDPSMSDKDWFMLREGKNHGPFCQLEIIQMLQEKSLFEYDFLYHAKLNSWRCIAEIEDFSNENIRKVKESGDSDVSEVFFRRRHARASYTASLIVHNNMKVFRGQALEIGAGGAGVLINSQDLQLGQSLFLHFQPGEGVPPFNAVCQIISKQFVRETSSAEEPVKYGVKFTTLSQSVRDSIKTYTTTRAA